MAAPTFDPLHPVQSAILESLAVRPGMSVQEMHTELKTRFSIDASVQNVYRIVAELIEQQVVVKDKGALFLHSVWIANLSSFVAAVQTNHNKPARVLEKPMKPGERREFRADSLMALDPVWFQVVVEAAKMSEGEAFYGYNSHAWYTLGMHEQDQRGWRSLTENGTPCYFVFGNDTFLDRYARKLLNFRDYHTAIAPKPPFPRDGYCLNVCGDHIFECVFPPAIAKHFAFFFDGVKSIDQFDAEMFSDVFRMKAACKLAVRYDPKEAKKLKAMFRKMIASETKN